MDEADKPIDDAGKTRQAQDLQRDLRQAGLSRRAFLDRLAALGVGFGVASVLGVDRASASAPVEGSASVQSSHPVLNEIIEEGRAVPEGESVDVAEWGGGYGGTPGGGSSGGTTGAGGYGGGGGGGYSRGYSRSYSRYERAYTRYERAYTRYARSYTRYERYGGSGGGSGGGGYGGGGGGYGGGGGGYGGGR